MKRKFIDYKICVQSLGNGPTGQSALKPVVGAGNGLRIHYSKILP